MALHFNEGEVLTEPQRQFCVIVRIHRMEHSFHATREGKRLPTLSAIGRDLGLSVRDIHIFRHRRPPKYYGQSSDEAMAEVKRRWKIEARENAHYQASLKAA